MSWLERVQTDFVITTGDGKRFVVDWINATKGVEFNVATFEFIETEGTLAVRGTPKGARYNLEFFIQGDDHLDRIAEFEKSAADPRPWKIQHPKYGQLLVQPMGYTLDDSIHNVTRISCPVVSTISTIPDIPTESAAEVITAEKAATDTDLAEDFATSVPSPSASTVQAMVSTIAGQYQAALSSIRESVDVESYINTYSLANSAITNAFTNSLGAITGIQQFVSLPFQFTGNVIERTAQLGAMIEYLFSTIPYIGNSQTKKQFEANGGSLIGSLIAAAVTNTGGSYPNRTSVYTVINNILSYHRQYINAIYGMQSANGGFPGSYFPGFKAIRKLTGLVNYGVNVLVKIAAQSKQERSFFLQEDSNPIMMAHQLYGYQPDDSALELFIETNSIGLNEMLIIRKGRKITYYV